jgi:two-component system chemotaxis response regulator CheB
VSDLLATDPAIEVVGTAANGRIALHKLTQLAPDLVVLDLNMPEMDGLETLRTIRTTHPRLPVIIFSASTTQAGAAAIDAKACGASAYVRKPTAGLAGSGTPQDQIGELLSTIRALCTVDHPLAGQPDLQPVSAPASALRVIAIGVSTGGPNALAAIIPELPVGFGVPILVVQHMPAMFTNLLAKRLNAQSAVTVVEARGGEALQAGSVYIAPGHAHLIVERRGRQVFTVLSQAPPQHSCRPSVDVLFRSVAGAFGAGALGVVLTGMGRDGVEGSEELARAGARILVQDEATSVVWGMPGLVAKTGLADRVLPLWAIAGELVRRTLRDPITRQHVPAVRSERP